MLRDVGVVCNCAMCDSYFVVVVMQVDYSNYRGGAGTKRLETHYEKCQLRLEEAVWTQARCASCMELVTGMRYGEWLQSDLPVHPSPARFVAFDEGEPPTLYVDENAGAGKPKWSLAQGVGPKTLETDNSRSNRLHKPTLRGILGPRAEIWEGLKGGPVVGDCDTVLTTALASIAQGSSGEGASAFLTSLFSLSPLFKPENWQAAQPLLATREVEVQTMEMERMRIEEERVRAEMAVELRDEDVWMDCIN
mmetsp:Transcript_5317/g.12826  ORF Transcript_5317/g.12826 Transcript_5317/m.12826 type:complete len:250 (+) Transcript_5317:150-899(+)